MYASLLLCMTELAKGELPGMKMRVVLRAFTSSCVFRTDSVPLCIDLEAFFSTSIVTDILSTGTTTTSGNCWTIQALG